MKSTATITGVDVLDNEDSQGKRTRLSLRSYGECQVTAEVLLHGDVSDQYCLGTTCTINIVGAEQASPSSL